MSKMNELSRQVTTTSAQLPALPADIAAELDSFRQAALPNLRQYLLGTLLKFKKGDWIYGEQKLGPGTKLIALMNHVHHGWLKWNEDKTATQIVGSIISGFKPPARSELGDLDEATWKIGLSGKNEDPWNEVIYIPFLSINGEQLLTFSTTTKTGRPQAWKFVDRYAWIGRKHPGQYPIVELGVGGFENQFGLIKTPEFKIIDWTNRPDITTLIGGGGADDGAVEAEPLRRDDDMNDEIPF